MGTSTVRTPALSTSPSTTARRRDVFAPHSRAPSFSTCVSESRKISALRSVHVPPSAISRRAPLASSALRARRTASASTETWLPSSHSPFRAMQPPPSPSRTAQPPSSEFQSTASAESSTVSEAQLCRPSMAATAPCSTRSAPPSRSADPKKSADSPESVRVPPCRRRLPALRTLFTVRSPCTSSSPFTWTCSQAGSSRASRSSASVATRRAPSFSFQRKVRKKPVWTASPSAGRESALSLPTRSSPSLCSCAPSSTAKRAAALTVSMQPVFARVPPLSTRKSPALSTCASSWIVPPADAEIVPSLPKRSQQTVRRQSCGISMVPALDAGPPSRSSAVCPPESLSRISPRL